MKGAMDMLLHHAVTVAMPCYEIDNGHCWCLCLRAVCLQLGEIVSRTRTIKVAVEAAVSKQFAGRRVNVLGEINNALSASV